MLTMGVCSQSRRGGGVDRNSVKKDDLKEGVETNTFRHFHGTRDLVVSAFCKQKENSRSLQPRRDLRELFMVQDFNDTFIE